MTMQLLNPSTQFLRRKKSTEKFIALMKKHTSNSLSSLKVGITIEEFMAALAT